MKPCSIFNEIYGPIMIGPSSSHTAGPARIGKVVNMLLDDEIQEIEIIFDCNGSFAATYRSQGSDFGFVGGILGIDISDENIKNSLEIAAEKKIKIKFRKDKLGDDIHPNFAIVNVKGKSGKRIKVEAKSTGGGMFEVTKYGQYPVSLKGDCYDLIVISKKDLSDQIEALLLQCNLALDAKSENVENDYVTTVKFDHEIPGGIIGKLKAIPGVMEVKYVKPILPVVKLNDCHVPFTNAKEAIEYAKANDSTVWEIASEYEEAVSGKSRAEIIEMMIEIVKIMRQSALKGIEGKFSKRGFLTSKAGMIARNINKNARLIDMGILNKVMVWATAAMEYDICMGKVVAAPTGGSCGVLPGAIVAVGDELKLSDEEIAKGLLAAGTVGVFIDHQATFAAEVCGCQAENGSASGMAAAGIVQLLGGSVEEAFAAASLALQNIMGLICDPVAGVGNVPCVGRNSMAAVNGIVSANMVLNGFDPFIPLDEVVNAMWETGLLMPKEFRCTGLGGLCVTKSAERAKVEFEKSCMRCEK